MNLYEKYYKEKAREEILPVLEECLDKLSHPFLNESTTHITFNKLEKLIKEING